MKNHLKKRFEHDILKVVAWIGLIRFIIAIILDNPSIDGLVDFYLDISTAIVFLVGIILVHLDASSKFIIGFFFSPLILLLWVSLYLNNGLASSGEINAFAIAIILTLTIQGRMPWVFVGITLIGVFAVLFALEKGNLSTPDESFYNVGTTALLVVTLANIFMTFHGKNVFDSSRAKLNETNTMLSEKSEEIRMKRRELTMQNDKLTHLKEELEEKVLERTERLKQQKNAIEAYMELTLKELIKPYEKTINAIKKLESIEDDMMVEMVKDSGRRLEIEVEKLRNRLLNSHE